MGDVVKPSFYSIVVLLPLSNFIEFAMRNANLIIALAFAGILGAALVYLILWYIHRYIHQRCLDLEHWFHVLSPHTSKTCVEKAETPETSKQRSRSRRKERGRSESRRNYDWKGNAEWSRHGDVERMRPITQLDAPQQLYRPSYYPVLGRQDQTQGTNLMMYGMAQVAPIAMSVAISQQSFPPMTTGIPEPVQYQSQYQARDRTQHRQAYPETASVHLPKTGQNKSPSVKHKLSKKARAVVKVDYIHICDEYPPIVQEALNKAAPPPSSSSSSSASSCSSETSGTTQEVRRASIPGATPAFTSMPPFQFPQYPQMTRRAWNAPRSYPRQWMGDAMGADVKARYAPFPRQ